MWTVYRVFQGQSEGMLIKTLYGGETKWNDQQHLWSQDVIMNIFKKNL